MDLLKIGETVVNLDALNYAKRKEETVEFYFSSPGGEELVHVLKVGGKAAEKAWNILLSEVGHDVD